MIPIFLTPPKPTGLQASPTNPAAKKSLVDKQLTASTKINDDFDAELATHPILLGPHGEVLNPEVRENCKKILRSAACPASIKEAVFQTIYAQNCYDLFELEPVIDEFGKMSDEIVAEGGHLELEDVHLTTEILSLNLRGANLRGLSLRGSSSVCCDMTDADLTGARFIGCSFHCSKMIGVKCAGLVIENSTFMLTEVTDTSIFDLNLLKLRLAETDDRLWNFRAHIEQDSSIENRARFFLHGRLTAPSILNSASCIIL